MSINQHFVEKLRRNDEILTDLIDYIVRFTYNEDEFIHNNLEDGRTISMIGERNFVVPIIDDWVKTSELARRNEIKLIVPPERKSYDILLEGANEIYIPCNIKISSWSSPDNLNIQNIQNMLCFGEDLSSAKTRKKSQEKHLKYVRRSKNRFYEPSDYYFICVYKNDMSQSFFTSALSLSNPTLNANNLVQCNWKIERDNGRQVVYEVTEEDINEDISRGLTPRRHRNYSDSIDLILDSVLKSYEMAIESAKLAINNTKKLKLMAKKANKLFNLDLVEDEENDC